MTLENLINYRRQKLIQTEINQDNINFIDDFQGDVNIHSKHTHAKYLNNENACSKIWNFKIALVGIFLSFEYAHTIF